MQVEKLSDRRAQTVGCSVEDDWQEDDCDSKFQGRSVDFVSVGADAERTRLTSIQVRHRCCRVVPKLFAHRVFFVRQDWETTNSCS